MSKNLFVSISLIGCSFASSLLTLATPALAGVVYERQKPSESEEVPSQIINLIADNQGNETLEVPTTSPNSNFNVTLPQAPVFVPETKTSINF
ncbi:MAG: hypothetical protein IM524_03835 [Pseudanabaena sp. M051S1SP1A06QC]|jgi:hypothetical protein|nr:hypothetical protein [Pseudanabaena sp. M051S1SP1A06QC]MCA6624993.1 hypothetical protein [Pseudanabaena sp. M165S2SP1A06QC]